MPGAIDFHQLALVLDQAEAMLSDFGPAIDRATAAELRVRIARARAELDFLSALSTARSAAKIPPIWSQLPSASEPGA